MHAVLARTFGGPDVLELVDVAAPCPPAGHVLVRVAAGAVNPPRRGRIDDAHD